MNDLILINKNDLRTMIGEVVQEKLTAFANWIQTRRVETNDSELLTTQEAAEMLKMSRSTLYRLRKKGLIPEYGLENSVYFKKSEILNALKRLN